MRAQIVQEKSLAYLARQLKFNHFLQLGKGEESSGGRERDSILADCFEAVLGAIYEDQGLEVAKDYLNQVMFSQHQLLLGRVTQDHKTLFQERVQKQGAVQIDYRLKDKQGPAHDQIFTVELYVNDQHIATGQGSSKKQAEMQAAEQGMASVDPKTGSLKTPDSTIRKGG